MAQVPREKVRVYALIPEEVNHIDIYELIYPVGAVYMTADDNFDPNTEFCGTWERVETARFLEAGDGTNGKTKKAAGLPDASGSAGALMVANARQSGALTRSGANRLELGIAQGSNPCISDTIQLNLANTAGNKVYGKSETVQPASYVVNIWERTA